MRFFLDTANLDELKAGASWGIVDGVTTNPSLIAKEGVPIEEQVRKICEIVDGDVSAEVVAIDTEDGRVHSHSATREAGRETIAWARECEERGAGELLVTSIDRDGTRSGYDLELLAQLRDAVSLPVIASGGAGSAQHVADALGVAQAALLASILHENPARLASLRDELRELGVAVRDAA